MAKEAQTVVDTERALTAKEKKLLAASYEREGLTSDELRKKLA